MKLNDIKKLDNILSIYCNMPRNFILELYQKNYDEFVKKIKEIFIDLYEQKIVKPLEWRGKKIQKKIDRYNHKKISH